MFGLINRGELPPVVEHEMENFNSRLKGLWLEEHNEDGTHQGLDAAAIATGIIPAARLPVNITYIDANNLLTGVNRISSITPQLQFNETDRGANLKNWDFVVASELFNLRTVDDSYGGILTALIVNRAGDLTVAQDLSVGRGVVFPATQVASSNANTLDDYEEGTYNPTITGQSGSSGVTYATQAGRYIKIGKKVTAWFNVQLSGFTSISGSLQIGGMPFTIMNVSTYAPDTSIYWANTDGTNGLFVNMRILGVQNSANCNVYAITAGATGFTQPTSTALTTSTQFVGTFSYEATT
jgi:hypothetical protein